MNKKLNLFLGILRITMGFLFLWAFFDKLFGLGFATCRDEKTGVINYFCNSAWLFGGSPTFGFLKFGTHGPFALFFQSLAGNEFVDFLFMIGLLGIGLSLILGIFYKLGTFSGIVLLSLMYLAGFLPPKNNPIVDEHIIYILVLIVLYLSNSQNYLSLKSRFKI